MSRGTFSYVGLNSNPSTSRRSKIPEMAWRRVTVDSTRTWECGERLRYTIVGDARRMSKKGGMSLFLGGRYRSLRKRLCPSCTNYYYYTGKDTREVLCRALKVWKMQEQLGKVICGELSWWSCGALLLTDVSRMAGSCGRLEVLCAIFSFVKKRMRP